MSSPVSLDALRIPLIEGRATDALAIASEATLVVADPPWASLSPDLPSPRRLILAANMDIDHLESLLAGEPDTEVVIGLGGGAALDTAKFIAWKTGKRLILIPTITSVDAAFTPEVGVRIEKRVRYIGRATADHVLLDLDLVRSAPRRLNRAGIGDILSCHTALFDWRIAADHGEGEPWNDDYASMARHHLVDLSDTCEEIFAVSDDGVRFLANTYQRLAAAITAAGHPRFEEGAEHFLAYTYEHLTGTSQVHGELIGMSTLAVATLQGNDPDFVADVIRRSGARCHPDDLHIGRQEFYDAVLNLPRYVHDEGLYFSAVNVTDMTDDMTDTMWAAVQGLPQHGQQ